MVSTAAQVSLTTSLYSELATRCMMRLVARSELSRGSDGLPMAVVGDQSPRRALHLFRNRGRAGSAPRTASYGSVTLFAPRDGAQRETASRPTASRVRRVAGGPSRPAVIAAAAMFLVYAVVLVIRPDGFRFMQK